MQIAMPNSLAKSEKAETNAPSTGMASDCHCATGRSCSRQPLLHISGNSAISAPFAFASRQTASPFCRFSSRESPGAICSSASFKRFILIPTFLFISRLFCSFSITERPVGSNACANRERMRGSIGSNIKKGMERFHPFLVKLIVMPAHGLGEFQNRHGQQRQSEADQIQPSGQCGQLEHRAHRRHEQHQCHQRQAD